MTDSSDLVSLPRRPFAQTGIKVTSICLGCAPLGSLPNVYYPVSEAQAFEVLRATLNSPIHFLDTAAAYNDGESERRIGVVLSEMGGLPPNFVLATKADRDLATHEFSGEQTKRSIERSLRLLGVDRLQIVYIHDPEYATTTFEEMIAPGGAVDVLRQYKAEGVIDAIGIAGGPVDLLQRYVETGAFDAVLTHNRYTLITRAAAPLINEAVSRGMAVLNAAPYGGGMLAKGPDHWGKFAYQAAPPELIERVRRIDAVCQHYDVPLAAAALQFSLHDPRITSTIVGMTRPERVADTIALAQHPIPEDVWTQVEEIVGEAEPPM